MVYCLYGNDSYRRGREVDRILSEFKTKQGSIGVEYFNFSSPSALDDFIVFLSTRSLFSIKKLAFVENASVKHFGSAREMTRLRAALATLFESTETFAVFSLDDKPPRQLAFLLEPPAKSFAFEPLGAREAASFAVKEALLRGVTLGRADASLIAEFFGSDLWAISTELDRLSLAPDTRLDLRSSGHEYFKLASLLKNGRSVRERLVALELLLSELREEPARIFNGFAYGRPSNEQASRQFDARLAEYDVAIKSGRLEYEEALLDLALS